MKTFLLSITLILSGFILGACGSNVIAEQTHSLKIWKQNENGKMETFCVVDEDTGVNYVVVTAGTNNTENGVAITPRLNADETLYISK